MANLPRPENPQWIDDIFKIETTTPWVGGENGTANIQGKQFAERTAFLKKFADEVAEARGSETTLLERIEKRGVEPQNILSKFTFIAGGPVAASTENVDVTEGGLITVDGIAPAVGNLVFLKNQTDKKENGFWEVQTGAWNRFAGYTASDEDCFTYKFILVRQGETNAGRVFFLDADSYAIGTDPLDFKESIFSPRKLPGKVVIRDIEGETQESEDAAEASNTPEGWGCVTDGRSLLSVLGVDNIPDAIEALHVKTNPNGAPDFSGLQIGDYLDLPSLNDGTTTIAWNETYKNLRICIGGFNTYKSMGSTENTKNHIVFTFENCPITKEMSSTNDNTGGYPSSTVLKPYLEGGFLTGLVAALGHDYMYAVQRLISTKSGNTWLSAKIFPPTEFEVFGAQVYGDEFGSEASRKSSTPIQLPIYRDSYKHRIKRYNGSRQWWWLSTPYSASSSSFCDVIYFGDTHGTSASGTGGVAPAFCVA